MRKVLMVTCMTLDEGAEVFEKASPKFTEAWA